MIPKEILWLHHLELLLLKEMIQMNGETLISSQKTMSIPRLEETAKEILFLANIVATLTVDFITGIKV